jgi:predicted ThiF/HesA family dinucleotide-utilizing enzyme
MNRKTVTIVGAGALGSHLVLLAREWEAELRVIDFDRVEAKNIRAQFHTRLGSGKNKARAIQAAMKSLFGVKLAAFSARLVDSNAEELLGGSDLVVDCTDNIAVRQVVQGFCRSGDIPCLHGCLSAGGDFARIIWTEHFVPDREEAEGQATCEDGRNLPFHGLAGALLAWVAQRFLEDGVRQSFQVTAGAVVRLA